jgi:hypothetical protein
MSNNLANIKRMEKRVAQLKANAERAEAAPEGGNRINYQGFGEVVENFEKNRLQIIFDGKPSAEIRAQLKSFGFRWAPSQEAWQRQLTNNARYNLKLLLKAVGVEG